MKKIKFKQISNSLLFWLVITALLFIILGGFQIQFFGNQTTKMLFGLADAGLGYLDQDWMANTKDPLLIFSWLVKVTYQYLDVKFFYVYQFILVGIYIFSLVMIVDHFYRIKRSRILFIFFLTAYLATYSEVWPFPLKNILHDGVAQQDLGLTQFLPNMFASFLFLSILLFLKERPYGAVLSLVVACNLHTNFLIAGAALVSAYLLIDFWEKRDFKRVLLIGGLALVLVMPVVVAYFLSNRGASPAQIAEANHIVANLRIPHHTQVTEWWNGTAFMKTLMVLGAIVVTRRTKLFPILLIGFLVVAAPTIALFIHPSNKIALLQLWRVSVILVPLSSAVLIGATISSIYNAENVLIHKLRWVIVLIFFGILVVVLAAGIQLFFDRHPDDLSEYPNVDLMTYVEKNGGPGEIYLIPPRETALNPFRLKSGQPIFINWKSHPWNTIELLEWYQRIQQADQFYLASGEERCKLLPGFVTGYQISHVVIPAPDILSCEGVEKIYGNDAYNLYQVAP